MDLNQYCKRCALVYWEDQRELRCSLTCEEPIFLNFCPNFVEQTHHESATGLPSSQTPAPNEKLKPTLFIKQLFGNAS